MATLTSELWGCGEVRPNPKWFTPPHRHLSHHELIVVLEGTMLLRTRELEMFAGPGDMLFYRSGLVHEEISQKNDPVHTIFIAFASGELLPHLPLHWRDTDGRVRQLVWWMLLDQRQGRSAADCLPLLTAIVAELKWLGDRPSNPWLSDLLSYMQRHHAKSLSLADLANRAHMSNFAFIRKFKRLTGRTPMSELRRVRLNEAHNLLLSSGLPLKDIAQRVGLGDEYQLSKLFRRHLGLPPRELRTRSPNFRIDRTG